MTMQFRCDCCGAVTDISQEGAADGASVSNDGGPPEGWRTIFTVIEEYGEDDLITQSAGEVLHSCADCNAHMDVDEHHEAELESRRVAMYQDKADT